METGARLRYSGAEGDASPDFKVLAGCRDAAAAKLGVDVSTLGLSMGMSHAVGKSKTVVASPPRLRGWFVGKGGG